MNDVSLIIIWVLITITMVSLVAVIGKRYGIEYLIATLATLVVMANIFASKIVLFGPFTVPAGVLVFSMTFLITDIINECWGKRYAYKGIFAGFLASIIFIVSIHIVVAWQPAPFASQAAVSFEEVFSYTPRILLAFFVAYLISQYHDVWSFNFWKKKTMGKHLWLRNNISTMTSQLIDSVVFIFIAFYGLFPIWPLIIGQWVLKLLIAALETPFLYLVIWLINKTPKKELS